MTNLTNFTTNDDGSRTGVFWGEKMTVKRLSDSEKSEATKELRKSVPEATLKKIEHLLGGRKSLNRHGLKYFIVPKEEMPMEDEFHSGMYCQKFGEFANDKKGKINLINPKTGEPMVILRYDHKKEVYRMRVTPHNYV